MKKWTLLVFMACTLAFVGCKKSTACWYPIDGGHINLDQVKTITSKAELLLWTDKDVSDWKTDKDTIISGVISEENINKAINKLRNSSKNYSHANANAGIVFDNFTVWLQNTDDIPGGWSSNEDLITLLKMWRDDMARVTDML